MSLPVKAKEAEEEVKPIIEGLQQGATQDFSPDIHAGWLQKLSGYHTRVGMLSAQSQSRWIMAKSHSEEAWASQYTIARQHFDMKPTTASIEADASAPYILARKEEAVAETGYRELERLYQVMLENIQVIKKLLEKSREEAKQSGLQT